jgi:hypothetical protein
MSDDAQQWGLAALGSHGSIEIQLDEPLGHDGPWHLQISGKVWEFRFAVADAGNARDLSAFVKKHAGRKVFAEHLVGSFQSVPVVLVKDSGFADRFWLRIRGAGQMAEVTIQDEDAVALDKALDHLLADLAQ